jgi:hypothetical protein
MSVVSTFGTPSGCTEPIGRRAARPGCPAWLRPHCSEGAAPGSGSFGPPTAGELGRTGRHAHRLASHSRSSRGTARGGRALRYFLIGRRRCFRSCCLRASRDVADAPRTSAVGGRTTPLTGRGSGHGRSSRGRTFCIKASNSPPPERAVLRTSAAAGCVSPPGADPTGSDSDWILA